jgi:hypothetical protein
MGSFNTTCFVSNQTIASGDKCRVIPIVQQATYQPVSLTWKGNSEDIYGVSHSTCYSTAFWKPAADVIPAEYDDYGQVKILFSPLSRAKLMSFFREVLEKCPVVAQGENKYHDQPFDFSAFLSQKAPHLSARFAQDKDIKPLTQLDELDVELTACWDYIFEVASEHRLFICNYQGVPRPLQFAVMHEVAYEALIAETANQKTWDGVSCEQTTFLQHAVQKAKEVTQKYAENNFDMRDFWFSNAFREALAYFNREGSYTSPLELVMVPKMVEKYYANEITENQFIERLLPQLNDRYALAALEEFNLKLSPMVYAGQDYQNQIGSAYAKFVSGISAKVSRGRNVYYHGEALDYQMDVSGQAQLDKFVELMGDSDSYVESVEILSKVTGEPSGSEVWLVKFSCPMDIEALRELVTDNMSDGAALSRSFAAFEKI